jgi:hypothetical protein
MRNSSAVGPSPESDCLPRDASRLRVPDASMQTSVPRTAQVEITQVVQLGEAREVHELVIRDAQLL